jgi:hypothetical protein
MKIAVSPLGSLKLLACLSAVMMSQVLHVTLQMPLSSPDQNIPTTGNKANQNENTQSSRQCFKPNMNLNSIPARALPKPFINVGFPKAGSTSLNSFFLCGGIKSSHFLCQGPDKLREYCGKCMQDAISQGLPPLKTCGAYEAFTQLDISLQKLKRGKKTHVSAKASTQKRCYWPQVEALDEIHNEAPNATFILNFRNKRTWVKSLSNWYKADKRMMECNITGSPAVPPELSNTTTTRVWLEEFFCNQVERVRDFVAKHPSHALIEVDIEDPAAGEFLSQVFEIDEKCWLHTNKRNNTKAEQIAEKRAKRLGVAIPDQRQA